jgi:hypothetical protein
LARDFGSIEVPDVWRALIERTQAPLTPSTSAISPVVMPSSVRAITRWRNAAGSVFIGVTPRRGRRR